MVKILLIKGISYKRLVPYALAIFAGLCGTLSQQPFGIWPLIFVFVTFQIFYIRKFKEQSDKTYLYAFSLSWVTYALGVCYWISYFGPAALIGFAAIQTIFGLLLGMALGKLPVRINPLLIFPAVFVVFELVQANFPILSFSWLTFSTTLIDTPLSVLARVGGGALLTFLVVFVSYLIYLSLDKYKFKSTKSELNPQLVIAMLVFFLLLFVASMIQTQTTNEKKVVTTIQGNDKNRYLTSDELRNEYLENSHLELAQNFNKQSDILIFPESAFNDDIETDENLKFKLKSISGKTNELLIANSIASTEDGDFNRNYFYDPEMNLLGTYDKKRLVPFGEYVPGENFIGSWSIFDPIGTGFKPGNSNVTIRGVSTLICFESAFSSDVLNAVDNDTRLLVLTTNNRSYRRSGNSEQHKALTRLRAIENGVSTVHASVSGSSALIERDGKVVAQTELFEKGVISSKLSWGSPDSLYSKTGDWLSILSLLVVVYVYIVLVARVRWKNQTSKK